MDCDHMVQETVEMGTSQYTGYPHAEADPEYSTVSSGYGKMRNFALGRHPTASMSRYLSICCAYSVLIAYRRCLGILLPVLRRRA